MHTCGGVEALMGECAACNPSDEVMESPPMIWDFDGNPIPLARWGSFFADPRVRVGNAYIGPVRIATDWIGVDPRGRQPPLIYETMIFARRKRDHNAPWNLMQWRYPTRQAALAAHIALVNRLRSRGVETLLQEHRQSEVAFRRIIHRTLRDLDLV
jgi:hypothetical protein